MIAPRRLAPRQELTRRPLPDHDPTIAELSPDERATATAVWLGRAESELRASGSFAVVAQALADGGAPVELVTLARRAITDERRHAQLCWEVASQFSDRPLPPPRPLAVTVPRFAVPRELERVLHVIGMCCLNETTGNAFLEVCRAGARGPLVRAALHELACDEIDHARIGWAFVAGQPAAIRGAVADHLPEMIAGNTRAWRARPHRTITDALVAQGCPRRDDVDAAVVDAIATLLVPGFAELGMMARA